MQTQITGEDKSSMQMVPSNPSNNNNNNAENVVAEFAITQGATSGKVTVYNTGVTLAPDTTWEQWREGLKFFKWARTKLAIGLADYIAFGNDHFGPEKVNREMEQLEFELTMVKTAFAINSLPKELRYSNLNSDHYVELARAQASAKQKLHWARVASEQHLTPTQLKLSMVEGEIIEIAAAKMLQHGIVTIHGIRQSFDVWLKKVGGLDGIKKMEHDAQEEIFTELESIVELGNQLQDHLEGAMIE